jgi:transposase-like protein
LAAIYPFIWVDALYEKVRLDGEILPVAVMVAFGINESGKREILGIEPMMDESAENWKTFLCKLKSRGLKKAAMFISDAHRGLQKALSEEMTGCKWQRCKVHFMRNIMATAPGKGKYRFAERLKQIWLQPDKESAMEMAGQLIAAYEKRYPEAISCLEEGLEDSLQFYTHAEIDKRKIASTNVLERLNKEIRRRSRVVGIFPNLEAYIRLLTSYLIEYSEDWETDRSYIKADRLASICQAKAQQKLKKAA